MSKSSRDENRDGKDGVVFIIKICKFQYPKIQKFADLSKKFNDYVTEYQIIKCFLRDDYLGDLQHLAISQTHVTLQVLGLALFIEKYNAENYLAHCMQCCRAKDRTFRAVYSHTNYRLNELRAVKYLA